MPSKDGNSIDVRGNDGYIWVSKGGEQRYRVKLGLVAQQKEGTRKGSVRGVSGPDGQAYHH